MKVRSISGSDVAPSPDETIHGRGLRMTDQRRAVYDALMGKRDHPTAVEVFMRVIFPLSVPGVFAGVLLTGIPAVADYVNQDLLGGVGTTMVGRVIETQFQVNINYPLAASLAFVFMLGLLATLIIYQRIFGTEQIMGG